MFMIFGYFFKIMILKIELDSICIIYSFNFLVKIIFYLLAGPGFTLD